MGLSCAVLARLDALLGAAQLFAYNRHHVQGIWPWLVAVVAIVAPLGAALILIIGAPRRDALYLALPTKSSSDTDSRIA